MVANTAWRSVEVGKEYRLTFQFDAESPWSGGFTAVDMNGLTVLLNTFKDAKFLQDFGVKQALSIYYNDKFVTKLPLSGSFAAMKSLLQCQEKVNALTGTTPQNRSTDPFSGGGVRPAVDPFRP